MYGAILRGAFTAAVAGLVTGILSTALGYMAPYMGPQDGLVRVSFNAIAENALLVAILGIIVTLLARANREASLGV
jgi:hypothetical protein